VVLLLAVAAVASVRAFRLQRAVALLAWVALGWACAGMAPRAERQVEILRYADGLRRDVVGTVTHVARVQRQDTASDDVSAGETEEQEGRSGAALWSVDLAVQRVEDVTPDVSRMAPVEGGVRVLVEGEPGVECGDRVLMPLRMREPQRYRDAGVWQYPDYLQGEGIGAKAIAQATQMQTNPAAHGSATCWLEKARSWSEGKIESYVTSAANQKMPAAMRLTTVDAGMVHAMLLGDRTALQRGARTDFERTGSFHLLVVAGMHVGLVAWAVYALLVWLRRGRVVATAMTLVVTSAYAVMTGFGVPVQRALGMTAVFLMARLFARRGDALQALGVAVLAMLVARPDSLFEASLQMTVLAVIAIAGIALPLGEWSFLPLARATRRIELIALDPHLPPKLAQFRVSVRMMGQALAPQHSAVAARLPAACVRWVLWWAELVLISVVSEALLSLPMMIYFHRLTPLALPANLLCVVLIGPLLLAAVALFVTACVSQWVAVVPGTATAVLLHAVTAILHRVSGYQLAEWRVGEPQDWRVATVCVMAAMCVWLVRRSWRWAAMGAVLVPLMLCMLLVHRRPTLVANRLEVTAIDVGQGDSIFVASPHGQTMLIDAGGQAGSAEMAQRSSYDIGEEVVSPALWERGLDHLDLMVLTHAHSDHMGGMVSVLRNFRPRELWVSVDARTTQYAELMRVARTMGVVVRHLRREDAQDWDGVRVQVLSPAKTYVEGALPANDDSLVMRMSWERASVLLEGDAEAASEGAMVRSGDAVRSTLLKVGHHGSRSSTTQEFLNAVAPEVAVISDGRGNRFGHPRMEVLERLQGARVKTYRTDMVGETTFLLDGDGGVEVGFPRD
jgi:competence protein ComEC